MRFVVAVRAALCAGVTRGRDLIVDSAPIRAWRRRDPDAAVGHAPAHHPTRWLRGYRAHTLLCRGSGLPLFVVVAPANAHDALSPGSYWPGPPTCAASARAGSAWTPPPGAWGSTWRSGPSP